MAPQPGLDAREATAALRDRSLDRLRLGFGRVVTTEPTDHGDPRDAMISMTPFIDCARRLGLDASEALSQIASTGPEWYRQTFEAFVGRDDITLTASGWSIVETPEGPAYRFSWPS